MTARAAVRSPDGAILEAVLRVAPIGVIVLGLDLRIARMSLTAESDGPLTAADVGRRLLDAWPGVPDDVIAAVADPAGGVDHVVWMWTDVFGYRRHLNGVVRGSRPGRSP